MKGLILFLLFIALVGSLRGLQGYRELEKKCDRLTDELRCEQAIAELRLKRCHSTLDLLEEEQVMTKRFRHVLAHIDRTQVESALLQERYEQAENLPMPKEF